MENLELVNYLTNLITEADKACRDTESCSACPHAHNQDCTVRLIATYIAEHIDSLPIRKAAWIPVKSLISNQEGKYWAVIEYECSSCGHTESTELLRCSCGCLMGLTANREKYKPINGKYFTSSEVRTMSPKDIQNNYSEIIRSMAFWDGYTD